MTYTFYKVLHIFSIVLLFVSIGGLSLHGINGGNKESNKASKLVAITHGVAMLLILTAGFGLMARLGFTKTWPVWLYPKLLIWLLMGGSLAVLQRKPEWGKILWWVLPMLAAAAAYLAIAKPGSQAVTAPASEASETEEPSDSKPAASESPES